MLIYLGWRVNTGLRYLFRYISAAVVKSKSRKRSSMFKHRMVTKKKKYYHRGLCSLQLYQFYFLDEKEETVSDSVRFSLSPRPLAEPQSMAAIHRYGYQLHQACSMP